MTTAKRRQVSSADLWVEPERGRRGPRPRHSREQIVRAAIAIADSDGLAGLSMETLAAKLRLTPMALYRHVPGKEELVALMVDQGLAAPPRLRGSWRARLASWARAMERLLVAHPWSIEATARLRVMGPNELAWLEAGMATLAGTRLTVPERHTACLSVISVVRTFAQFSVSPDLSGDRWADEARRVIAARPGYPQIDALLRLSPSTRNFERAVAWVLDGIATRA